MKREVITMNEYNGVSVPKQTLKINILKIKRSILHPRM